MRPSPPRGVRRVTAVAATAAVVAAGLTGLAITTGAPAGAASARSSAVASAERYAADHGYRVGISVLDTKTGAIYGGGQHTSGFASESVIKVMIAARLIVQGRMHGTTSRRAYTMITQSDDTIANSFYGSVGGDGLLNWTKKHWNVPSLGTGPIRSGWWGSNRLTSDGLVRLYAKLKADRRVGPWLLHAMHGHTRYGSDGFYQNFGLPQANSKAAVKQGWGADYSYSSSNASMNSTGFVNGDRYAVAILARGPASSYGSRLGNAISAMAKRLLPGGSFPSNAPVATSLSTRFGNTAGGGHVSIRGREFTGATRVAFGGVYARFSVRSSTLIVAVVPKHSAGTIHVAVRTPYGSTGPALAFRFGVSPVVSSLSQRSGPATGRNTIVLTGAAFTHATKVAFGSTYAPSFTLLSSTSIRVVVPAKAATSVHVRVRTIYGVSAETANDAYTFEPANPATTRTAPASTAGSSGPAPSDSAPSSAAPSSAAPSSPGSGDTDTTAGATPVTLAPSSGGAGDPAR